MKYYNPFLFEDKETVKNIEKLDSFLLVEFEDTIFYPGGGGQPCDLGFIESDKFKGEVIEVSKKNDNIIHKIKIEKGDLKQGDNVVLKLNQDRRLKLIKMHSGEHVLFKALEKIFGEVTLNKIDLDEKESSLFINTEKLNWKGLFEVEKLVNKIIDEDRKIFETYYTKDEAIKLGKLRIKPERIKSDKVRVVEVKDFDWSACMGIHLPSTKHIGNLLITKFNFVKGKWEIRFKTDVKEEFYELAKITRESATLLETDNSTILESIKKLQNDVEEYKLKFREMSTKLLEHNNEEKIKNVTLIYNVVEGVEKKQLVDKANSITKEKTIVCFISRGEKNTVLLKVSEDLKLNASKLLNKILEKFNGKGGGRDSFAMGSFEGDAQKFINELKILIK